MAYSFGGGVRPELGRTDYSGYLQGALQGARSNAAGSAAIGQGIANSGEAAGDAIQKYQQNKVVLGQQIGKIEGAISENPDIVGNAPPEVKKMLDGLAADGTLKLKDAALVGAYVDAAQAQRASMTKQQDNLAVKEFLETGNMPKSGLSPAAMNSIVGYINAKANQTKANGTQKATEGRVFSREQYEDLKKSGIKYKATPLPDGTYLVKEESGKMQSPISSESAFNRAAGSAGFENAKEIYNKAYKGVENIEKIDRTTRLVEEGDPNTGLISEIKTNIQRAIAVFSDNPSVIEQLSDTELLKAALGSEVFKAIGELGIGARGIDTPAERDFLREVLAGKETLNKRTILEMLRIRRDQGVNDIEQYNSDVSDGLFDDFFKAGKTFRRGLIDIPEYPKKNKTDKEETEIIKLNPSAAKYFEKS